MKPYYIIETSLGPIVGFNRTHLCITMGNLENCKRFASEKSAFAYITKYADIGYGLSYEDCIVKKIS